MGREPHLHPGVISSVTSRTLRRTRQHDPPCGTCGKIERKRVWRAATVLEGGCNRCVGMGWRVETDPGKEVVHGDVHAGDRHPEAGQPSQSCPRFPSVGVGVDAPFAVQVVISCESSVNVSFPFAVSLLVFSTENGAGAGRRAGRRMGSAVGISTHGFAPHFPGLQPHGLQRWVGLFRSRLRRRTGLRTKCALTFSSLVGRPRLVDSTCLHLRCGARQAIHVGMQHLPMACRIDRNRVSR